MVGHLQLLEMGVSGTLALAYVHGHSHNSHVIFLRDVISCCTVTPPVQPGAAFYRCCCTPS